EIYTLSLHDALPISGLPSQRGRLRDIGVADMPCSGALSRPGAKIGIFISGEALAMSSEPWATILLAEDEPGILYTFKEILEEARSEEHTSELQSPCN